MQPVLIELHRFVLRDFTSGDRAGFVAYQMDPRYLGLYDLSGREQDRAEQLFDRFVEWQGEAPRRNFQVGVFDPTTGRLLGCAGLRQTNNDTAVFGMELAPSEWGRFRLTINAAAALVEYGFETLQLQTITGETASGNRRVEKLARYFGAKIGARRPGPDWMRVRGWEEVDWSLSRAVWERWRDGCGRPKD
jgi:ribosomal-protein-alanine N-acetyltransferase